MNEVEENITARYPPEKLDGEEDDGTMPANVAELRHVVIGRRIVKAERGDDGFIITLDDGHQVCMRDTDDCCAFTTLNNFLLNPTLVDHIITGVGTTEGFSRWHIYADYGDILQLEVGWSCGNPFYYGYGFHIDVCEIEEKRR